MLACPSHCIQEQYVTPASVYTLSAGSTRSLSSILSTSGSTGTIYYETSDPDVATVSDSGTITARSNGRCTIYAISGGGSSSRTRNSGSEIGMQRSLVSLFVPCICKIRSYMSTSAHVTASASLRRHPVHI